MPTKPQSKDYIINLLKKKLADFDAKLEASEVGSVTEVGDGVARISGLAKAASQEMVIIKTATGDVSGVVLNLETDSIGVMILGDISAVAEGDEVRRTERILEVPVGEAFLGRVISPLGEAQDGKGAIKIKQPYPVEKTAPGVTPRQSVSQPVQTCIKAIDAMIPIGRGQRELIIGDRQTGKTAIALDTIINQKSKDVVCIYVAIGQKESKVAKIVKELTDRGAMDYTILVVAGASSPAALSY